MNKLRRASLAGKSSEQPGRAFILRALNICVLILTARDSARKPRALRKTARAGLYIHILHYIRGVTNLEYV